MIIWQLFNQLVIGRSVWGREPDQAVLQTTYEEDLPEICNYLEGLLPAQGWLFGALSIADIALACFLPKAQFARYRVDGQRWPRLAAWSDAVLAEPAFARLGAYEMVAARTPIGEQRAALLAAGAPLSEHTVGRAGPMSHG